MNEYPKCFFMDKAGGAGNWLIGVRSVDLFIYAQLKFYNLLIISPERDKGRRIFIMICVFGEMAGYYGRSGK